VSSSPTWTEVSSEEVMEGAGSQRAICDMKEVGVSSQGTGISIFQPTGCGVFYR
jgi:hypothetical protein